MKKILALVLVFAMCLSLCACGNSSACTCDCPQCALCEQKTHSHATQESSAITEEQEDGTKVVFPEPVLLAEDDKVRVELVSFIQEDSVYGDIGKYIALKITNKADFEIGVWLENLAVNNESADARHRGGETPKLLPGETTTYFIEIRDAFNNALDSLDQLYTLKGRFKVLRRTGTNSYADSYEIPFSVESSLGSESASAGADTSESWTQFRDYLKKHGPITVVTSKSENGQNQFTIEENAGSIRVSHVGESSVVSGNVRVYAHNSMVFDLPSNAKSVTVQIDYSLDGYDENGNRREQSATPSYTWNIQSYRSGDEISFAMVYSELESNGTYVQKTGTMTTTNSFAEVADALSQTLDESGLGITMADLGFTNY